MTDEQTSTPKQHRLAFNFDGAPLKLGGWVAHEQAQLAQAEIAVRLMAGDVVLGRLRRDRARPDVDAHLGHAQPPCGFNVPDFGLRAFAALGGITDLAIVVESDAAGVARHAFLDVPRAEIAVAPLSSRSGVRDALRLADAWLGSVRDLSLRFDAVQGVARSIDAYQCTTAGDGRLVKVAADHPIGGFVSIASFTLLNPFLPVLLVFKGEDGAIDAIDLIAFPSLVRGGLHAAERLIIGNGSDDIADCAAVSTTLLRALLHRPDRGANHVATIVLDRATDTGLDPMLGPDLLAWASTLLGVGVSLSPPGDGAASGFIADALASAAPRTPRSGHKLYLPADSIPTISALVQPLPGGMPAQRVVGSMGVVDWDRLGRIWSLWQPPLGDWLDGLQADPGQQTFPILELEADAAADGDDQLALSWPLSLALREKPTRIMADSPFEMSSELPVPLLRNRARPDPAGLSVIILCQRGNPSLAPLLESLLSQEDVAAMAFVVVTPRAKVNAETADFLSTRLADRNVVLPALPGGGKLDQIIAARDHLKHDRVLIIDANTILPDPRTLATLLPMLDSPKVTSVGCMVHAGQGKSAIRGAGYSPLGVSLRAVPSFAFGVIDPAVFRQPATFPVIANSMAVLATTRSALDALDARGSTSLRLEVDDLLFGIQSIERGGLNLCTTIVSAFSTAPAPQAPDLGLSIPYRLSPDTVARLMSSTIIVQTVQ